MNPDSTRTRMDAVLLRACARRLDPCAFYLTTEDWDAHNAEISAEWGSPCFSFLYRDVEIRRGECSLLSCHGGAELVLPRRSRGWLGEAWKLFWVLARPPAC